jgi:hypothetical protein
VSLRQCGLAHLVLNYAALPQGRGYPMATECTQAAFSYCCNTTEGRCCDTIVYECSAGTCCSAQLGCPSSLRCESYGCVECK